ncbi:potassium channel family protein [Leifsonia sp. ZF2019]|uniref:potassium channel family protein n=1 Tax=Leifsonia sp. ZF2019 TaxID=2781978 RepID=UPI001CC19F68|nr:potassium channel family protein [Leifsonia sp. ZF2019]UAJ80626.1 potassium channel family protein [Leifsonia sp. ZF2019]
MGDDAGRERWERATAWPGVVASVVFLIAYSWEILDERPARWLHALLVGVLLAVWLFFLVDYVIRFALADDKVRFVRRNKVDLLSVFLPMARPFRLLTGLSRIHGFRGDSPAHVRRRVLVIAGAFVVMFIYTIALAVYRAERYAPGGNIHSFGDAVWWACVTMATVGYGDFYPVTITGRVLAVVLMIGGIAIVGTASATVVSFLNERTQYLRHDHSSPRELGRELPLPADPGEADSREATRPDTDG